MTAPKRKKPAVQLRVVKGGFEPYDAGTVDSLRSKRLAVGDVVAAVLTKARNPQFNAKVHVFGKMLAANIAEFEGMEPHAILKRLQWEANIGCEEMGVIAPGLGAVTIRIPQSLSFESMDEGEFSEVYAAFKSYVVRTYWQGMTDAQLAEAQRFYEGQA